jgi:hypothetical protein
MTLAELRAEPLQQADLLVGQGKRALGRRLLQAQQAVVLGQQDASKNGVFSGAEEVSGARRRSL